MNRVWLNLYLGTEAQYAPQTILVLLYVLLADLADQSLKLGIIKNIFIVNIDNLFLGLLVFC